MFEINKGIASRIPNEFLDLTKHNLEIIKVWDSNTGEIKISQN
jgi:hypothetical protein